MKKFTVPIAFIVFISAQLWTPLPSHAQEPGQRIQNSIGMELVLIRPGKFLMGSPEDEPGRFAGEILHAVNVTRPFYLQTTEVTQAQWLALMGDNPSSHKRCEGNCPVEQISWEDAQRFIQKLNQSVSGLP